MSSFSTDHGSPDADQHSNDQFTRASARSPVDYYHDLSIEVGRMLYVENYVKALELSTEAYELAEKIFHKYDARTFTMWSTVATCLWQTGKLTVAEDMFLEIYDASRSSLGKESEVAIESLFSITLIRLKSGNEIGAKESAQEMHNLVANSTILSSYRAPSLFLLAVTQQHAGDYSGSVRSISEAYHVLDDAIVEKDVRKINPLLKRLSNVFIDQLQQTEALYCAELMVGLVKRIEGKKEDLQIEALQQLTRCYDFFGDSRNGLSATLELFELKLRHSREMYTDKLSRQEIMRHHMTVLSKLIECGDLDNAYATVKELFKQEEVRDLSDEEVRDLRLVLACIEYHQGQLANADALLKINTGTIYEKLPNNIRKILEESSHNIADQLPEALVELAPAERQINQTLLLHLRANLTMQLRLQGYSNQPETESLLSIVYGLDEVLNRNGAAIELQYLNKDRGQTEKYSHIDSIEALLEDKKSQNSLNEFAVRLQVARDCYLLGMTERSLAHAERAALLFSKFNANFKNVGNEPLLLAYIEVMSDLSLDDQLKKAYELLEAHSQREAVKSGPLYPTILRVLAKHPELTSHEIDYQQEAQEAEQRLTDRNPGYHF